MGAGSDQGAVTRTAAWINMMLHTERATRGQQRAFVRYGDLLDDWTQPVFALGEAFDLAAREDRDGRRHRRGAPLHRPVAAAGHDDVGRHRRARAAPRARRRDLAGARRDRPATTATRTRSGATSCAPPTAEQYAEAEAFAHSTVVAQRRAAAAEARREAGATGGTRSGADRVPHAVRAMVPPAARQKLRKAMGRERSSQQDRA